MKCKKCRKKLIEGSNFCTYCGTEVEKNLDVKDTKQKEEKNVLNCNNWNNNFKCYFTNIFE